MTTTKTDAHWRVDRVNPENYLHGQTARNIPVAWFIRRWQAEQYIHEFAGDPLNTKFSHLLIDENPAPVTDQTVTDQHNWMIEHGGDEAGYIEHYGNPGLAKCYGEGGSAIWRADCDELERLQQRLPPNSLGNDNAPGQWPA